VSHPDLGPDAVARLQAELGVTPPRPVPATVPATAADGAAPAGGVKAMSRKALQRAADSRVGRRGLEMITTRVSDSIEQRRHEELDQLAVEVALLSARLESLVPALHALQRLGSGAEIVAASADLQTQLQGLDVNQELLKAELLAFRVQLDEVGDAIAPAAGLPGVPSRFAELRERVNALDRRSRTASAVPAPAPPSDASVAPPEPARDAPAGSSGFDYVGFEHRFRGESSVILPMLETRYRALLEQHQPVLDFGCGRGELVAALREHGIDAVGVDADRGMVEEAQAKGLPVEAADGITWLREQPEGSLGSIISVHVVEHLELATLVEFLDLAATRLRPGGLLVAETPNPASLIVLGNSYILDPTHVWPLHPSLLTFLCERAGFRSIEQRFYSPADGYHLPLIDEPGAPAWTATINEAFTRINDTVFGPQEYAVVATTPDQGAIESDRPVS